MKACPECGERVERIEIKNTWDCKNCQTFWKVKKSLITGRILLVKRESYSKMDILEEKNLKKFIPALS